jgi:hypothetical protein
VKLTLLLFLIAVSQAPAPTTINGDTLGSPEEFSTAGPARICMREMAVNAKNGETVSLKYAGIHSGTLSLVSNEKSVDFDHGEIWKKPKRKGKLISKSDEVEIYRTKRRNKLANLVWISAKDYDGKRTQQPVVWISGPLLDGGSGDWGILAGLDIRLSGHKDCDRTYAYGWGMLFGDEPLSTKREQ